MKPLLELGRASVFFDGTLYEPSSTMRRGSRWTLRAPCGAAAHVASCTGSLPTAHGSSWSHQSGGYSLGMAFDRAGALYVCDLKYRAVMRRDPRSGAYDRSTQMPMVSPKFPVIDHERGCLYVSDSNVDHQPGGGVWRCDLATGAGDLWWAEPMDFANGMALDAPAGVLYVAESWGRRVTEIKIGPTGCPPAPVPSSRASRQSSTGSRSQPTAPSTSRAMRHRRSFVSAGMECQSS